MRGIKFRFWDSANNRFITDGDIYITQNGLIFGGDLGNPPLVDITNYDVVISQYTGLKDKNGQEIYEGDIVWDAASNKSFIVEWDDIGTGYLFHNVKVSERTHGIDYYEFEEMCNFGFEVTGNIYENPELLEAAE